MGIWGRTGRHSPLKYALAEQVLKLTIFDRYGVQSVGPSVVGKVHAGEHSAVAW